jgi:hypothetical protein
MAQIGHVEICGCESDVDFKHLQAVRLGKKQLERTRAHVEPPHVNGGSVGERIHQLLQRGRQLGGLISAEEACAQGCQFGVWRTRADVGVVFDRDSIL